ncbi:MAG: DUF5667 domain-containing protein [Candidatus Nealsonbacteria bacterium]|nr:DUF5667 domain-containing protein [Candidatus Nealsonbacteria bacterium]
MDIIKTSLVCLFVLLAGGFVLAQEADISQGVESTIALDEEVSAADLGIGEPNILPDNSFYFIKNWIRSARMVFTFDAVKKAELRQKFSNEKLIEVKKLVEQNKDSEIIKNATQNYQDEVEKIKQETEKIKEKARENEQVGKFLDKFIQQQALHERILQKLETQVPEKALVKIQEARESHLERFGEVMNKLEDNKEQLQERIENNLQKIKGSEFKEFKNLELLKELEENAPEAAKESIKRASDNSLLKLQKKTEEIPAEMLEKFKIYTEKISGEKEGQIEILEKLRERLIKTPALQQKVIESTEGLLKKIEVKKESQPQPQIQVQPPAQIQEENEASEIRKKMEETQQKLQELQGQIKLQQ